MQLKDKRDELGETLRRSALAIQFDSGKAHAWTFAGGRINQTLRYIFASVGGFMVTPDNFQLRIEGESVTHNGVNDVIDSMREPEFWSDRSVWGAIVAALPEYRLSKFQRALPPQFSEEMVMNYLLDKKGARQLVETQLIKSVDLGDPRFGTSLDRPEYTGRRVDLMGRSLDVPVDCDPILAIRQWLRKGREGSSATLLAKKAVILLSPIDLMGTVIWPEGVNVTIS